MDDVFKFKKDFKTGDITLHNLGRLTLASGNVVRLVFSPEGLILIVPKESLTNGDVITNICFKGE